MRLCNEAAWTEGPALVQRALECAEVAQTVWKFRLKGEVKQTIEMPEGASILHISEHDGSVCIWAQVDPEAQKRKRTFLIFETGESLPDNLGKHVGTFLMYGAVIHHAYEVRTPGQPPA